jgi:hypothetical protein
VARHDVLRRGGGGAQRVIGVEHVADVEGGGKRPAAFHILVIMAHVGGEHDPAAARMDAHELHARCVPADRVQRDARRQFDRTVIEPHAAREIEPDDADDILNLERAGEKRVPHVVPGRVVQFFFLQMKFGPRKAVKGADMVVVQVGQDHVGGRIAVEPDQ